ncbi:molybdate ABC transporter substrate-binding protein [Alteribacillus sp. YIM 98480]|uniref:molybdate ABC transporter substrate-binding protein n=1 Tax=Alteribacillus sp. YIM 98480 TaxID=2606599 RepID=UPI00131E14F2|nr:molybdate ABC transporter substrate-binding protein [Alteribacillus sp. YIM 98480]
MNRLFIRSFFLIGLFFIIGACTPEEMNEEEAQDKTKIYIMAAASLTDALNEVQAIYEEKNDLELSITYGSSGQLRQQISQGAPADIFLSASQSDMEKLESKGETSESTSLLLNELIFISNPEAADLVSDWDGLLQDNLQGVAIGRPEIVPAGQYARQSLEELGIWKEIENNIVYGSDVRKVLTYVETGNVDAGIVYKTDAMTSDKVEMIASAPEETHDPISYPVGLLKTAQNNKEAHDFYEWLQTDEPLSIFESYGFERHP